MNSKPQIYTDKNSSQFRDQALACSSLRLAHLGGEHVSGVSGVSDVSVVSCVSLKRVTRMQKQNGVLQGVTSVTSVTQKRAALEKKRGRGLWSL